MHAMRIGFFTDSYLPNVDGVVRSLLTNREALERRGHFVSVYASSARKTKRANHDSHVHYFPGVSFPLYKQYKIALQPFNALSIARRERLQIVHCHGIASMGVTAKATARALRLPLVGTFHTLIPRAAESYLKPRIVGRMTSELLWRVFARFYREFDVVTAPSYAVMRELAGRGVEAPLRVIPNAVDCSRFKPAPLAARARAKKKYCAGGEALVLCAGRVSAEKNIDVLIRAMPAVLRKTPAKLVVTGDGPAKRGCRKLAELLGLEKNVVFTGFVDERELPALYAAADCFASASTFETQGLALLEAMACGTPCAAARSLAFEEEVRDGRNGLLFDPGDDSDCAKKIVELVQAGPRKRASIARAARETAKRVDVPLVARKWEDLYAEFA